MNGERLPLEYVLPLRRRDTLDEAELTEYLRFLDGVVDITVVDGSDEELFARLHEALDDARARHIVPAVGGLNGKARGAMTGVLAARHELVVIADDDVRYDEADLQALCRRLDGADVVRVQNFYRPLPWWARWDTGRMLLNRALGGDYGGTLGVRRSLLSSCGGYRTDVLFENLELERTVRAVGGRVDIALDLLVARRPPALRHFVGQRVRQAYDDLAQPGRLVLEAAILPLAAWALSRRRFGALVAVGVVSIGIAEVGRRRAGGRGRFPASSGLFAPLWIIERSITVWLALLRRVRGGIGYGGSRIRYAASSPRQLARTIGQEHGDGG